MADGIVQYIQLMIDPASKEAVSQDASVMSSELALQVAAAFEKGGSSLQQFHEKAVALRATLEQQLTANRGLLKDDGSNIGQVKLNAKKLGTAYNEALEDELGKAPAKFRDAIMRALKASSEEMNATRPRSVAGAFKSSIEALPAIAAPAAEKAGKAVGEKLGRAAGKQAAQLIDAELQAKIEQLAKEHVVSNRVPRPANKQAVEDENQQFALNKLISSNVANRGDVTKINAIENTYRAAVARITEELWSGGNKAGKALDQGVAEGVAKDTGKAKAAAVETGKAVGSALGGAAAAEASQLISAELQASIEQLAKTHAARNRGSRSDRAAEAESNGQQFDLQKLIGKNISGFDTAPKIAAIKAAYFAALQQFGAEGKVVGESAGEEIGKGVSAGLEASLHAGAKLAKQSLNQQLKNLAAEYVHTDAMPKDDQRATRGNLNAMARDLIKNAGFTGPDAAAWKKTFEGFITEARAAGQIAGKEAAKAVQAEVKAEAPTIEAAGKVAGKAAGEGVKQGLLEKRAAIIKELEQIAASMRATLDERMQKLSRRFTSGQQPKSSVASQANLLAAEFNTELAKQINVAGRDLPANVRTEVFNKLKADGPTLASAATSGQVLGKKAGVAIPEAAAAAVAAEAPKVAAAATAAVKAATGPAKAAAAEGGEQAGKSWSTRFKEFVGAGFAGFEGLVRRGTASVKDFVHEYTHLINLPPIQPISYAKDRSLFKAAKGDIIEYTEAVRRLQLMNQLSGASFTKLGSFLKRLGVDVSGASNTLKDLVNRIDSVGKKSGEVVPPTRFLGVSMGGLGNIIGKVAGQFGILYAWYKIIGFLKATAEASNEAEVSWTRLSISLSDVGTQLSRVAGPINAAVEGAKRLGFNQHETVEILGTLVQLTGSYEKAMKGLPVVMDLVVSRHVTFEQASKMVAWAILGNVGLLGRYGITLNENRDALEQLSEMMGREAATRANTFGGQVKVLSATFYDLKVAIGDALKDGFGADGMMFAVTVLEELVNWVKENQNAFKLLGVMVIELIGAIYSLGVIFGFVWKSALVGIGAFVAEAQLLPTQFKWMWAEVMLLTAQAMQFIAGLIDKVFHTQMASALDGVIEKAKELKKEASADIKLGVTSFNETAQETMNGTSTPPTGPRAPDFELGTGGPKQAKEEQRLQKRITQLKTVALGHDGELSIEAMQELSKVLSELEQKQQEINASTSGHVELAGQLLQNEKHIVDIKKIQAEYDKQQKNDAAARRAEAELSRRITLLGQVAESQHLEAARRALVMLDQLHAKLLEKQKHQNVFSEAYFQTQKHIKDIEQIRVNLQTRDDKSFDDRIKKLGQMVDLNVNQQVALEQLGVIMKSLNDEYARELLLQAMGLDMSEAMLKTRERQAAVERATRSARAMDDQRIVGLEGELQDPKTHDRAYHELLRLRQHLVDLTNNEKTLDSDRKLILEQIARIDKDTADSHAERIRLLQEEVRLARQLYQEPKAHTTDSTRHSTETVDTGAGKVKTKIEEVAHKTVRGGGHGSEDERTQAEEKYNKVIQDGTELLKDQTLSQVDRLKIEQAIIEARHELLKLQEPLLNFHDRLKEVFGHSFPAMVQGAASQMADVMESTFEKMGVSAKTLTKTLMNVPKGLAKAMAAELKEVAKNEAKRDLAWAIREGALGIGRLAVLDFGGATQHFASAAEHIAAAAAWAALGGAAGAAAGKGGGGANSVGLDQSTNSGVDKNNRPVSIYIRGGLLDTDNFEQMDALAKAMKEVSGRDVVVQRS